MTAAPLVGLVVGVIIGLTGMGGGAVLTPALVWILGIPAPLAVGSDVFIASVTKFFSGGVYAWRRLVDWKLTGTLALGSVPGAFAGVLLLNRIPPEVVNGFVGRALGVAMLLSAATTVRRLFQKARPEGRTSPPAPVTVALGFATGVLVSLTSVGSGSLLCCVLFQFFPLPTARLVGTDIVHGILLSAAASIGHAASGRLDLALAASVLVGAVPGAVVGARLAGRIPERALRVGLAAVLAGIGFRMALGPAVTSTSTPPPSVVAQVQR
jgi:uncharacterized membrane protein YfcA